MSQKSGNEETRVSLLLILVIFLAFIFYFLYARSYPNSVVYIKEDVAKEEIQSIETRPIRQSLDTVLYEQKMLQLANNPAPATTTASSTQKQYKWPVKTVYPNDGALLPFGRIVAYYGNFYSTKMGALGEYEPKDMLSRLLTEVRAWEVADPSTPVIPAIHYIVTVAQGAAGADGDWTSRMPDTEIDKAVALAKEIDGIVFLDVQPGQSTIEREVTAILPYLTQPEIHLGIDPEFAMKNGRKPGEYIGTLDASEINNVIAILSKVVNENNLPPKVLVIHRFTHNMVTNYQNIRPTKEVQVVMQMDGWGTPELKTAIYRQIVTSEPVQFTGIKIFYKNDLRAPSTRLLTPKEILDWNPRPSYVQYQ